jgi:hypothetical protein
MYLYGPNSQSTLIEENDDSDTSLAAKIVRSLSPGTYYVKIQGFSPSDTGTYTIGVSAVGGGSIAALTVNAAATGGNISPAGDMDWYQFTVSTAGTHTIETWAGSLDDTYMELFGPNNQSTLIEENDDGGTGIAAKIVRSLSAGTYYVRISSFWWDVTGTYTIRVTRP